MSPLGLPAFGSVGLVFAGASACLGCMLVDMFGAYASLLVQSFCVGRVFGNLEWQGYDMMIHDEFWALVLNA